MMGFLDSLKNLIPGRTSGALPTLPATGNQASSSLQVSNSHFTSPAAIDSLMLDKNVGQHKHAAEATMFRARWAKEHGLDPNKYAMPFPGNTTVTNVKQASGILPMLAGAALAAATAGGSLWGMGAFDKAAAIVAPVVSPVIDPQPPAVAPQPQNFDADVIMEVIPPKSQ